MANKIIELLKLPSGATARTVFLDIQDLYPFIRLLKEVDRYFLRKD